MLKSLSHVEYRCPQNHAASIAGCEGCALLAAIGVELERLRQRRAAVFARMCEHLKNQKIIIVEVR